MAAWTKRDFPSPTGVVHDMEARLGVTLAADGTISGIADQSGNGQPYGLDSGYNAPFSRIGGGEGRIVIPQGETAYRSLVTPGGLSLSNTSFTRLLVMEIPNIPDGSAFPPNFGYCGLAGTDSGGGLGCELFLVDGKINVYSATLREMGNHVAPSGPFVLMMTGSATDFTLQIHNVIETAGPLTGAVASKLYLGRPGNGFRTLVDNRNGNVNVTNYTCGVNYLREIVWNVPLSVSARRDMVDFAVRRHATSLDPSVVLVGDGHSILYGFTATQNRTIMQQMRIPRNCMPYNIAQGSSTIGARQSRLAANSAPLIRAGKRNILMVQGLTNDALQGDPSGAVMWARLQSYVTVARTVGYNEVWLIRDLPIGSAVNATANARLTDCWNLAVASGTTVFNGLIDTWVDGRIGTPGVSELNTQYAYTDAIHWNDQGNGVEAAILDDALRARLTITTIGSKPGDTFVGTIAPAGALSSVFTSNGSVDLSGSFTVSIYRNSSTTAIATATIGTKTTTSLAYSYTLSNAFVAGDTIRAVLTDASNTVLAQHRYDVAVSGGAGTTRNITVTIPPKREITVTT